MEMILSTGVSHQATIAKCPKCKKSCCQCDSCAKAKKHTGLCYNCFQKEQAANAK